MNVFPKMLVVVVLLGVTAVWSLAGLSASDVTRVRGEAGDTASSPAAPAGRKTLKTPPVFLLGAPKVGTDDVTISEAERLAAQLIGQQTKSETANATLAPPGNDANGRQRYAEQGALAPADASRYAVFYPTRVVEYPFVDARVALVADLTTGEAYLMRNNTKRWPIASITKLLTAVNATRTMSYETEITITASDVQSAGADAAPHMNVGETYTVNDLVTAILVISSNEGAEAIARAAGRDSFISGMNELVRTWGMTDTHIAEPAGLSPATQSTANDLRILAQRVYEDYPALFDVTWDKQASITDMATGRKRAITNINIFAGSRRYIGGKTGYIDEAGSNLLSVFTHERRPVFVVVLGAADRFSATETLINWFRSTFTLRS